jgi:phosphatidate cytidylyltransferase
MAEPTSMTSLRPARRFDWNNLGMRAASAAVLIPAVVGAIFLDWLFLVVIALSVGLLAFEWSSMSARRVRILSTALLTAFVLAAMYAAYRHNFPIGWLFVALGAFAAGWFAYFSAERPGDAAFGVVYIAAPCLALTWLRAMPNAIGWTILLFAITWSADIFAYAAGNSLKGPKLWPSLSPNKTWSGLVGGLVGAMIISMTVAGIAPLVAGLWHTSTIRLGLIPAALIGLAGGVATMAGDLCESMLKRRFGVKDSGDLIPGHGGLLDRVDGLLFAALAVAGARLIYQSGWAR